MDTLNKFLCDWGSPDSNMLLFFLLISFLLGLLAGWLIWGKKIQAMLEQVKERDITITDINAKLNIKESELNNANKSVEELMAKNRSISEEKGQLIADLMAAQNETSDLKVMASLLPERDSAIEKHKTELSAATLTIDELNAKLNAANENNAQLAAKLSTCQIEVTSLKANSGSTASTVMAAAPIIVENIVPDNLKIVEGIGPKIESLLNQADILTFQQLASASNERLKEILEAAGSRYRIHDPSTWARQAQLAFEEKWEELKVWQDELKGGKE